MYDVDDFNKDAPLDKHDFIGSAEYNLHEIVGNPSQQMEKPLTNLTSKRKSNGYILVHSEEQSGVNNLLAANFGVI